MLLSNWFELTWTVLNLLCRLQGYMGAEGDEARALLRAIQSAGPLPQHAAPPGPQAGSTPTTTASGTRRSRANLSNLSGFSRSSARRQSSGYAQHSFADQLRGDSNNNTTPPRSRGALDESDMDAMTPSQSLQMEYTAMSLSPTSAEESHAGAHSPQHPYQPR
jgi:hypothetical protein